jgi:hypothetical protein
MRNKLLIFLVGLALAGCNPDPNVATPNQVVIAVNAYNAAVATGRNYLVLPLCSATAPTVCRTQALSQSVYTALKSGRAARTQLLAALAANQAAPVTAVQALEAAYSVIQSLPQH